MPITDILEKNCRLYGDDVCLVEINPEMPETKRSTWKEYDLIEPSRAPYYRREITWNVFNEKANRFANLLLERGVQKGDKVGILLMNCLEWLPIYFGILKTGALAVPLNFRYSADEIKYCVVSSLQRNLAAYFRLLLSQQILIQSHNPNLLLLHS